MVLCRVTGKKQSKKPCTLGKEEIEIKHPHGISKATRIYVTLSWVLDRYLK